MRGLSNEELRHVYGAGNTSCPPRPCGSRKSSKSKHKSSKSKKSHHSKHTKKCK